MASVRFLALMEVSFSIYLRSTHLNDLEIIKRDYFFTMVTTMPMRGGYCGALQRLPPPLPAALNRRLLNRDRGASNFGKVKTFTRVLFRMPIQSVASGRPHESRIST